MLLSPQKKLFKSINSQATEWDSWVLSALKSIQWGDPIFQSAAWFFVIILKFIFTPIFEIQIHEKIPWHQKKNKYSKVEVNNTYNFYTSLIKMSRFSTSL